MTATPSGPKRKVFVITFLFVMTVCNIIPPIRLIPQLRNGYQDFTIFYAAGRMVRSGQTAALYDLGTQYRVQREFAPNVPIRSAALPYNHPSFEALLFVPLTFLSYIAAYRSWTILNLAVLAASLLVLAKSFPEIGSLPRPLLVLAGTGFPPIAIAIVQGQDSVLLMFLFAVALAALEHGNDAAAGAALALGLFRFHLVLPLVFLLAVQRPRLLRGFTPIATALTLLSVAMIGWRGVAGYTRLLLNIEDHGAGGAVVADMPSLHGIISRLMGTTNTSTSFLLTLLCSVAAILFAWWQMRSTSRSLRFSLVLATVVTILVSYHTLTHDLSVLLPIALLLFAAPLTDSRGDVADLIFLALLYLVLMFEPIWPPLNQFGWAPLILFWMFWKFTTWTIEQRRRTAF
jgi:hypothetical protein